MKKVNLFINQCKCENATESGKWTAVAIGENTAEGNRKLSGSGKVDLKLKSYTWGTVSGASRKVKIVSTSQTIQTVFNKIIILKIVVKCPTMLTKTGFSNRVNFPTKMQTRQTKIGKFCEDGFRGENVYSVYRIGEWVYDHYEG